jgi:uridine kinase/ribulose-5-phosphate 4-epimerase/fuculose-1-phosphate aldolase
MLTYNKFFIGISGPSGVGKTTISHLISYMFKHKCLIISGDDLHKWERNDDNWNKFTHFNPEANNLDLGFQHLEKLKNGLHIERSIYNHSTGKFDALKTLNPENILIYEGLHTLYDERVLDLLDLKIYVDTNEDLTKEWKLKRDIQQRGYSKRQVEDVITRRKEDQKKFIDPQKNNADVIVKFFKNNDKVEIDYFVINNKFENFVKELTEFYNALNQFIELSKMLSTEISLTQSKGGNISIKYGNKIIIKESGQEISNISILNGFSICENTKHMPILLSESQYENYINEIKFSNKNPSMEIGFHIVLHDSVVIHTHPIYLNTILCSKEAKEIIEKLFNHLKYEYINYILPGYKLAGIIKNKNDKNIYFLENHGLIVSSDNIEKAFAITVEINNICKKWIDGHVDTFVEIKNRSVSGLPLFPDAVVLKEEMGVINKYMVSLMKNCFLTPKFLTKKEINEILELESEKKRKEKI